MNRLPRRRVRARARAGRDRATLDRTDLRRSIERVVRRLAAVIGG